MKALFSHRILAAIVVAAAMIFGSGSGATAAGKGEFCGGFIGIPCDNGLWCAHPAGQCNVADGGGVCEAVPRFCTRIYKPVCGCNGKTYGNDCTRRAARAQLAYAGRCRRY